MSFSFERPVAATGREPTLEDPRLAHVRTIVAELGALELQVAQRRVDLYRIIRETAMRGVSQAA